MSLILTDPVQSVVMLKAIQSVFLVKVFMLKCYFVSAIKLNVVMLRAVELNVSMTCVASLGIVRLSAVLLMLLGRVS